MSLQRLAFRAVFLLGHLPLEVRRRIAKVIGMLIAIVPTKERSIALLQIEHFIKPPNPKLLLRRVYQNVVMTFLECLNLDPILRDSKKYVRFDNLEAYRAWCRSGQGLLSLASHTGNWELLAAIVQRDCVDFLTAGKAAQIRAAQEALETIRAKHNVRTVWRDDEGGLKTLIRQLRSGGMVASLFDQDTDVASAFVPLFGVLAKTPISLVEIAKKLNVPICHIFLVREESGTFRIFAELFDSDLSAEQILLAYNQRLEALLKNYPDQWVWFHKRWRSRPDGRKLRSNEYIAALKAGTLDPQQ